MNGRDRIDVELAKYLPGSMTHRLVSALLRPLPGAPAVPSYTSFVGAAEAVFPGLPEAVVTRAEAVADEVKLDRALFVARTIDTGDTGLTVVTGVRTALALFGFQGATVARQQQRADTALKAVGIGCLLAALLPGQTPAARVAMLNSVPAGRQLALYFAAIEVALPLGDEVGIEGRQVVHELVAMQKAVVGQRLLALVGASLVSEATATLDALLPVLDGLVREVGPHARQIAETVGSVLPKVPPDLPAVLATAADALPTYRYLAARLAAELCLALAKQELVAPEAPPLPAELAAAATVTVGTEPPSPAPPVTPPAVAPPSLPPPTPSTAGPATPATERPAPPAILVPLATVVPESWPHEPLPAADRMPGTWQGADGRWLCFRPEGLVTDHPPTDLHPDWDEHAAAGHAVGRYQRVDGRLAIAWPGAAAAPEPFELGPYTLTFGGQTWTRADFDLTGRSLDGTWGDADGTLTFRADGTFVSTRPGQPASGRYRLGPAGVALVGESGEPTASPLLSTAKPSPASPAELWLGGVRLGRREVG